MDLKNVIILISAGINSFLGFFIYLKGKKNKINKVYGLFAFSVAYWCLGMVLYRAALSVESSIFWCKVLYTAPIFIVINFLFFTFIFPEEKKKIKKIILIPVALFCSAVFYIVLFTNGIVENVNINSGQEKIIDFGSFYIVYSLFISGFFIWSYVNLLRKRFKSSGVVRTQLTYIFLGILLASTLGMVTNLTLPTLGIFFLNWLGQILSLIMVVFVAYAIVAHRLMDIKLVLRRSSVYIFSLTTVLVLSIGLRYLLNRFIQINPDWLDLAILVAALYLFPPVRDFYYRLANKYFFSSLYDSRQVIAKLSDQLRSTLEINRIYDSIAQSLTNSLHIKNFGVLGYEKAVDQYFILYNVGFKVTPQQRFGGNHVLHRLFVSQSKTIVVEELKNAAFFDEVKDIYNLLTSLGVAALVPLSIKNEILGLLALGPKESGDMFNDEDLQMLETIASQSAVAIKNAQSYEETKNFSAKLQTEVARQTAALRQANEDLQKLDKAKSDFISIASHQLRTPLSIVKGYVSMILEGSYGEVAAPAREKLENIYESNERLNRLVDDLLDLSHMEGGKMKFDFTKVDFGAMARSVVGELQSPAEKKNLKLIFEVAKDKFFVRADEGKLRQVVFNLVDNALKYTSQGQVIVALGMIDGKIRLAVKDTGIGINQEDLENLFQKFIRGANASHYHTEGVGIGLYVAKKMIEEHQGRVWAESDGDQQGSQFYIELPMWAG